MRAAPDATCTACGPWLDPAKWARLDPIQCIRQIQSSHHGSITENRKFDARVFRWPFHCHLSYHAEAACSAKLVVVGGPGHELPTI